MIIDYLGGTNKIPRVLVTKKHHDIQVKKRIIDNENMWELCALRMMKSAMNQGMEVVIKNRKGKEIDFLPIASKEIMALPTAWFQSSGIHFRLLIPRTITHVLFKLTKYVAIYYFNSRKQFYHVKTNRRILYI